MGTLARLTQLGCAKEATQGTYVAPSFSIPWNQAEYQDVVAPLRDESVRANDAVVQGIVAGPAQTDWAITTNGYADIIGNWFVAMGLFDTITAAGISTTLSAGSSIGATSISTAASIPTGSTIRITSAAGIDYAITGVPSGTGPFTIPIATPATGLLYAHLASDPVVSQYTHTFKQNRTFATVWPSYSLTTNDGIDIRGWAGCVAEELVIKIDPKGLVTTALKFNGWPSASQSSFSYAASTVQPMPAWAWTVTNAGGASTRGLTMDLTLKRVGEAIHASTGLAGPREVFAGALEADGAYKAIFDVAGGDADFNLFRNYVQTITTHTLAQPLGIGAANLAMTMAQSGYITAKVVNTAPYLQLDVTLSGIQNATDGGVASVVLKNYVSTVY